MQKTNYKIDEYKEIKDRSEIFAKISIPGDEFEKYKEKAIKNLAKAIKVPGFRAGKAPKEVVIKNVGIQAVNEEAATMAIQSTYPQVLDEKNVLIIDAPMISVTTDVNTGEDLTYTITAPVPPQFDAPDYKKLAKKIFGNKIKVDVTDKEVADALLSIRRRRMQIELIEKKIAPEKAQTQAEEASEKDLPELDKGFIQSLGDYKNIDELKASIRDTIKNEKELQELNKRRSELAEELIKNSKIPLPTVIISHELDRLQAQFEADLERIGTNLNAYLKSINKTREDFLEELRPQAEKQAKLQLLLNRIAELENIIPPQEQVDAEVKHLLQHHKDANKDSAEAYVTMQLRNQMVFDFLESLGNDK